MASVRVTSVLANPEQFHCVRRAVERLVLHLPAFYAMGLDQILLREASGFTRKEKSKKAAGRKRQIPLNSCLGVYYGSVRNRPARIELFIDNITAGWPAPLLCIPPLVDAIVGKVVFHELGHHIHATSDRRFSERETVAEEWRQRLSREYFRRRYSYLRPFAGFFRLFGRLLRKVAKLRRFIRGLRSTTT